MCTFIFLHSATSLAHCFLVKVKGKKKNFWLCSDGMCHSLYILFQKQKISHSDWHLECQLWASFWRSGQQGRYLCEFHLTDTRDTWAVGPNSITLWISLCELYKHKYHGISSHIWCYFISINNCDAKAFKRRLSEVQIFCDLIYAAVFHVSRN